ncbi:DUF1501 domain-containing protein [Tuwongella immobilis]|uniref:DUF1501 domain-containing protein n=1 Tax=Tuwongella immobilis TaxID=692036 RepID=A0A6C2YNJ6_9BACT|nr:DUF1501 domain-containing protein [Tuwongella immobilis]VIP02947.1 hypothetical protein : Uncharacterized protein OS=Pirellula staleyi (strain ATCC 27377 / DSM 6068 / ICPB 4128) GN=Psta_0349 PE=4 SV=1: DUF1501 [Tuwongella immobilis]VTS02929.1 hypothetical protein : Uncharacterized protein OS=Pirellula staleyi (strain ATCC 27377 / DSM 6068 / ICPB 4128) GN=Psta_0349 PE=4 SV=1: DUF1501 [Tuwongella immobilis]
MARAPLSCPGPLSRRDFLRIGALSLGMGAGVTPWKLEASADSDPDTAVILVWLPGGAPHMETYDLKLDAPLEYRGEFRPIRTNVPGIDVCEHLPLHAKIADKFAIIRSFHHTFSDHGGGHKRFLTGRDPFQPVGFVNDHPMVGSMVAKMREQHQAQVPNYVSIVDNGRSGIDVFSFGSAYLGPSVHPFTVVGDVSLPTFQVKNLNANDTQRTKLTERVSLLGQLDSMPNQLDPLRRGDAMDANRSRAMKLLMSEQAAVGFDLKREPAKVRERYGMHVYGQRALLARRLVEHGASFVSVVMENPTPTQGLPKDTCYNWDSHAVNCHLFTDSKFRLPYYDQAVTALIEDLYTRGLDRRVLLIVTGEFGRTPRITYANGRPGRDHWPQSMSMIVSGGGLRMGQVIGSTNSKGEHPKDRPMSPNDLWATMFRHLEIDYVHTNFIDNTGRPMPILPDGEPIRELI